MDKHVARRRFGQNFLVDAHYIDRIVDAVDPQPGDNIVEIGPGLAALTGRLVARAGSITAVEIDRDLAARLRDDFTPETLRLVEADALVFDFASLGARLRIVGNLPYNISSPLLFRLAGLSNALKADIVATVLQDHAMELPGAFTVISPGVVRIRHSGRP